MDKTRVGLPSERGGRSMWRARIDRPEFVKQKTRKAVFRILKEATIDKT